jgi:hypothetical protein
VIRKPLDAGSEDDFSQPAAASLSTHLSHEPIRLSISRALPPPMARTRARKSIMSVEIAPMVAGARNQHYLQLWRLGA